MDERADIMGLLELARAGDGATFDRPFEAVCQQLHAIVSHRRERCYPAKALNTTAFLHEAHPEQAAGTAATVAGACAAHRKD